MFNPIFWSLQNGKNSSSCGFVGLFLDAKHMHGNSFVTIVLHNKGNEGAWKGKMFFLFVVCVW